jgi:hypothetical protein
VAEAIDLRPPRRRLLPTIRSETTGCALLFSGINVPHFPNYIQNNAQIDLPKRQSFDVGRVCSATEER